MIRQLAEKLSKLGIVAVVTVVGCSSALAVDCQSIVDVSKRLACYDGLKGWDRLLADVLANPQAIAAIIAAVFAFISGIGGPTVALLIGRKQAQASQTSADAAMQTAQTAGLREVAKLRMSWMETLRSTLAEYHSILMNLEDTEKIAQISDEAERKAQTKANKDALERLILLGTHLDLLLNKEDELQGKLWTIADDIYKLESSAARQNFDEPLMTAGRAVLKGEWEKVKREMKGAEFQTGAGRTS